MMNDKINPPPYLCCVGGCTEWATAKILSHDHKNIRGCQIRTVDREHFTYSLCDKHTEELLNHPLTHVKEYTILESD